MEFFRITQDLPFMRYAKFFNILSFLTFFASLLSLFIYGLHFSVEFVGGSVIEIEYGLEETVNIDLIRQNLTKIAGVSEPSVQNFGSSYTVSIRLSHQEAAKPIFLNHEGMFDSDKFVTNILVGTGDKPKITRVEFVGAQVSQELFTSGIIALLFVCIGIILYLSGRFEWRFAISAIIANLHDIIIIFGFFSFFQWEFSLSVLAGVLSVLGYSVNESVVVFDRVRETLYLRRTMPIPQVLDHAITTTISRTVITHLCTQIMVTTMLFFGGAALHNFALALTIGICVGIYSSVLVSCPLLICLGLSPTNFYTQPSSSRDDPNYGAVV